MTKEWIGDERLGRMILNRQWKNPKRVCVCGACVCVCIVCYFLVYLISSLSFTGAFFSLFLTLLRLSLFLLLVLKVTLIKPFLAWVLVCLTFMVWLCVCVCNLSFVSIGKSCDIFLFVWSCAGVPYRMWTCSVTMEALLQIVCTHHFQNGEIASKEIYLFREIET